MLNKKFGLCQKKSMFFKPLPRCFFLLYFNQCFEVNSVIFAAIHFKNNKYSMKKILLALVLFISAKAVLAQQEDTIRKKDFSKIDLSNRANDHFMIQYGGDTWGSTPDSINTSGFSRHFNLYLMFDKPFKTNPNYSVAFGAGIGSSNIFFSNTYIDIKSLSPTLQFKNVAAANHFSKYKLTTFSFEVPVEFRYVANPEQPDKGFKIAIGLKGGTLLSAHTKGKNLVDSLGNSVYGPKYISKEYNKKYINTTRLAVTGRIGLGNISIDASYQITQFLKPNTGPKINPVGIGITISGL